LKSGKREVRKSEQPDTPIKKTRSNILNQQLISRARCGNGLLKGQKGAQTIGFGPGALRLVLDAHDND
jgi:hypothetical protein